MKKVVRKKTSGLGNNLKNLGVGVGALYGVSDNEMLGTPLDLDGKKGNQSIGKLSLEFIEPNPYQPRHDFDESQLSDLIDSIKVHGVVQPITVRRLSENSFQIISGERRFRASKAAGLSDIPAYIREANDQEMREIALIENIQRQDLNAIEIGLTYQSLIEDVGLTHKELAERVGKSRTVITNALRLLKLPPEIQDGIKTKKISAGHGRALCGAEDAPETQLEIYKIIIDKNISVRQVEKLVSTIEKTSNPSAGKNNQVQQKLSFAYQKIQDDLCRTFETKVALKPKSSGKGGEIVIPYMNDDELNRILEQLP